MISEDKIMFGIHAHAMSLMTVAKIRKVYNKIDAKSIAKQVHRYLQHCTDTLSQQVKLTNI